MKKSLLTVALAALATTAFANIDLYKTNDVTLGAYGSLEAKLALGKADLQSQELFDKKLTEDQYTLTRVGVKVPSYKAKLGLFANYKNAEGFMIGLDGRVSFGAKKTKTHTHTYSREYDAEGKVVLVTDEADYDVENYHKTQSLKPVLHLDRAYLTLGHPQFGYLTLGKTTTVADDFANTTSDILEGVNVKGETDGDFVVKYHLPTFTDNLDLSYSFTNNYNNEHVYSRSHAALLTYSDNGLTFGSGFVLENLYSTNSTFGNFNVDSRSKSAQVYVQADSVPYVEDLSALVSYTYTKEVGYKMLKQNTKDYNQVGLVEVKYNVYDVVTPYVGYAFTHHRLAKLNSDDAMTVTDTNQVYVGLASSYKFDGYAKVSAFVEGAFAKAKSRSVQPNADVRSTVYDREFKVGAKVSF